jgi:putative DNA primase/helicase
VKKADACASVGLACVALSGVWNWKQSIPGTTTGRGSRVLPELENIPMRGRQVVIAFDSDFAAKDQVRKAAERLGNYLSDVMHADVLYAVLPDAPNGDKQGLDDYFVNGGTTDDLAQRIVRELPGGDHTPSPDAVAAQAGFQSIDDFGLAEAWAQVRPLHRFVLDTGVWFAYDSVRWCPDNTEALVNGSVRRHLIAVGDAIIAAAQTDDEREVARSIARSLRSANKMNNVTHVARTEPRIQTSTDAFDSDPWLLNAANGTIDLRTGALRPHDPNDLLTGVVPVDFDPSARAPKFEAFLAEVQPDAEMRAYIQRLLGHTLVGEVFEHVLPIFHGVGRNGKSVLANLVLRTLGMDFSWQSERNLLVRRTQEQHPTNLASLQGRRFVVTSETSDKAHLDEALVKSLTGGDQITARKMRENFTSFRPSHSIVLLTNHKPDIDGADSAIWRRITLVPFSVVIPVERQDTRLEDKIAADELSGILTWLVQGCLDWQRHGLREPDAVQEATSEYQADENHLLAFIGDCLVPMPGAQIELGAVKDVYRAWTERKGIEAVNPKTLKQSLEQSGQHTALHRTNRRACLNEVTLSTTGLAYFIAVAPSSEAQRISDAVQADRVAAGAGSEGTKAGSEGTSAVSEGTKPEIVASHKPRSSHKSEGKSEVSEGSEGTSAGQRTTSLSSSPFSKSPFTTPSAVQQAKVPSEPSQPLPEPSDLRSDLALCTDDDGPSQPSEPSFVPSGVASEPSEPAFAALGDAVTGDLTWLRTYLPPSPRVECDECHGDRTPRPPAGLIWTCLSCYPEGA